MAKDVDEVMLVLGLPPDAHRGSSAAGGVCGEVIISIDDGQPRRRPLDGGHVAR